jgi:flagellar motor switch protein FliG
MATQGTALVRRESRMSGREKAAILYMALGSEQSAKITQRLTQDEAELISLEIAKLNRVEPDMAEAVLIEWIEVAVAGEAVATGGVDYAREVLDKAYGTVKSKEILKRIMSQLADTAGLQRLRNADPQQIANMLRTEHPQTIALILAHLQVPQTAGVLKELDPAVGGEVTYRMAKMEKVSPEMLMLIERSLGSDSEFDFQAGNIRAGGPSAVASVLNLLQGALEKTLLEKITDRDHQLAEQIKNLMFVFEDVSTLDDRALQRLLRDIDAKTLALALKGASGELKERIMSQMSQRAVASLKEEMEMLGPVRMRDVEGAQTQIVAQVRALEDAGEIVIGAGDEVVVS